MCIMVGLVFLRALFVVMVAFFAWGAWSRFLLLPMDDVAEFDLASSAGSSKIHWFRGYVLVLHVTDPLRVRFVYSIRTIFINLLTLQSSSSSFSPSKDGNILAVIVSTKCCVFVVAMCHGMFKLRNGPNIRRVTTSELCIQMSFSIIVRWRIQIASIQLLTYSLSPSASPSMTHFHWSALIVLTRLSIAILIATIYLASNTNGGAITAQQLSVYKIASCNMNSAVPIAIVQSVTLMKQ